MKKIIYFLYLPFILSTFVSCNSGELQVKKFFNRLNAHELNCSAKYIWPEDHVKLYIFNKRFIESNELMSFDVEECTKISKDGSFFYVTKLKCNNLSDATKKYFKSLGKYSNGYITETFQIKKAHDIEYLSFNWGLDTDQVSEDVKCYKNSDTEIEFRAKPNESSLKISTLAIDEEIIVDNNYDNENWYRGFIFKDNNLLKKGYFKKQNSNLKEIKFFDISWFDSIGIIYISILAIIVFLIIYPLMLSALFRAGAGGAIDYALKLLVLMIIVSFVFYQLIEKALFEWFLINLPY